MVPVSQNHRGLLLVASSQNHGSYGGGMLSEPWRSCGGCQSMGIWQMSSLDAAL